jgi:hypothetical protein
MKLTLNQLAELNYKINIFETDIKKCLNLTNTNYTYNIVISRIFQQLLNLEFHHNYKIHKRFE